jgi:hypothetical protein
MAEIYEDISIMISKEELIYIKEEPVLQKMT